MRQLKVNGCSVLALSRMGDNRGSLVAIQTGQGIPFEIGRVYYVFDTKTGVNRGFHAHRHLRQLLVAVSGSCTLVVEDGQRREQVPLDNPLTGLLIEGLVWREMRDFTPDCVLLVLADRPYDESDYIRDYGDFLDAARTQPA